MLDPRNEKRWTKGRWTKDERRRISDHEFQVQSLKLKGRLESGDRMRFEFVDFIEFIGFVGLTQQLNHSTTQLRSVGSRVEILATCNLQLETCRIEDPGKISVPMGFEDLASRIEDLGKRTGVVEDENLESSIENPGKSRLWG